MATAAAAPASAAPAASPAVLQPKTAHAPKAAHPPKGLPGPVHPLPAAPGVKPPQHRSGPAKAVAGPSAPAPRVAESAAMRADAQAVAQARATGKPVAVPSQTSPTSEVLAQPNGQFELVSNTMPVRVRAGGAWHAISTGLRRDASGTWSAPRTAAPVTFSGGGSGPLVTVTDSLTGKSVSMTFPYPLPQPAVTGSTALYKDVFPGTDLRLQATSTGYSEVLIVQSAAAAADPRLRSLTFTLHGGAGVSFQGGPDGSTAVVDSASGKELFASGQPVMWDTAPARFRAMAPGAPAGADGSIDPVPVRHAVGIRASRAQATVTLTPSTTTLAGRPVNYPLYIDPQINETSAQYYSQVGTIAGPWNTTTGTTSQPNGVMEIGFCGYDGNFPVPCVWNRQIQFFTDRAFFRMDTSVLEPNSGFRPSIYSASFAPHEVYNSATCTAEPIAVWSTSGGISSSTDWPGPQGSQLGTASSAAGGGTGCSNSADVPVDITSYVQAHAQSADAPASMTFEVRAPDETQKLQFKKISDNPTFTVWFSFAPLQPTDLSVQNAVTCTSTTYTSLARPILSARGVDNNPAFEDLFHTISLYDSSGSLVSPTTGATGNGQAQNGGRHSGDPQSTNVRGQWAPGSDLSDGQAYHFTDQTQNLPGINDQTPPRNSPVADPYYFTVLTASLAAPSVTSFDYPVDASGQAYWGQPQGAPGVFTVGTNGAAHIAGFAYSFDGGSASEPVPSTTDCNYLHDGGLGTAQGTGGFGTSTGERALVHGSTAQIQAPASLAAGRHTLWVTSFDLAHNASGETPYVFYVAPNYQSASQPRKTYLPDDLFGSAGGPNLSLLGEQNLCCGMTTWPGDNQLFFQSTAINQSYSVTVNVPAAGTWQLGADMTTASDYGKVRFDLDGANLGGTASTPFDGYTASVSSQYVDLGTQALTAGAHTLAVKVTDQNASSAGFKSGLIYLTLSPTNRYEADTLPHGGAAPQCFGLSAWENNCQLFFANTTPGASFTVTFPAPVESDYALGVNLTKASDYGTLEFVLDPGTATQFVLDGTDPHSNPPGNPVDAHASPTTAQYVFLGGVHLAQGPHVLQVIVTGTSSTTGNLYNAGINYVAAAPVTGAMTSSFTAAMNNLGVATDNSPSLAQNFDLTSSATGSNLSRDALQAAGITVGTGTGAGAGNTFSLGGAAFTMPPLRTDPVTHAVIGDNVIPDGQIIQVPPVTTSGVALLVTTTCGGSPAASATLGYSAARNDNPVIPAVSNWKSGPTNVAVMQLGHYDSGSNSTPASTAQPRLYEVMLPANPSSQLTSVTLPVLPVSFLTDTGTCPSAAPTLHVLAIGFRPAASAPAAGSAWTGAYDAPMDTTVPQSPAISDRTYREAVPLSSPGGGQVRIHLSNAYSDTPVAFDAVTIAAQSSANSFATTAGPATVAFGGHACTVASGTCVTIPAGGDAYSDPVALPSMSGGTGKLTVSLHVPASASVPTVPIHQQVQGVVTLWASGNATGNIDGSVFSNANSLQGGEFLSGVDVSDATSTDGTIAVLGDQTAAAAPAFSTTTWPADLPSALASQGITMPGSVVNASTSDAPPDDRWRMTGLGLETGTTAFDSGTTGTNNLTMNGGPTWSTDDPGTGPTVGSLSLTGNGQSAQSAGPVLDTTSSFAVSAWVKISSLPTRNAAVAAQDGTTNSSFYLGYNYSHSNTGVWAFYFAGSDATNPAVAGVYGTAAVANAWTLLTAVYNASAGTIQLWVNGALAASTSYTPSWSGSRAFTVGRSRFNGAATDYFPGEITDVRAYQRLLSGTDVRALAADGDMSTVTANNADLHYWNSALDYIAASEPNLRDVIVSLGANDVLRATGDPADVQLGQPQNKLEGDLGTLIQDLKNRFASNQPGVFVHVFITTIPPLGLPASDPREQVREKVNTWILDNSATATDVFNIATAVASSSSPNLVNPSYLTGGVPNSSYYSVIASYIASHMAPSLNATPPSYTL